MTLATAALLEHDMGTRLPNTVRQALIDIGATCNEVVLAINAAEGDIARVDAARVKLESQPPPFPWATQSIGDRLSIAYAARDHLAVALARIAAPYAAYASHVAVDVLDGRTPAPPSDTAILPSTLIADAEQLLPVVMFPSGQQRLREQNDDVNDARETLFTIINDDLRAGTVSRYDTIGPALDIPDDGAGELTPFPDAVLTYASTVVWALGIHTSRR